MFKLRDLRNIHFPRKRVSMGLLVAALLLTGNIHLARAHNWGNYHWDQSGSVIRIDYYNTASNWIAAEYARADGWNTITKLYNYDVTTHGEGEVSVFDAASGNTGWSGLATITDTSFDWGSFGWNHINHCHAQYNTSAGFASADDIQGIFCQETAHCWGLDHSDTGDCMGKTYYNNINNYGPHNNADFNGRYP